MEVCRLAGRTLLPLLLALAGMGVACSPAVLVPADSGAGHAATCSGCAAAGDCGNGASCIAYGDGAHCGADCAGGAPWGGAGAFVSPPPVSRGPGPACVPN